MAYILRYQSELRNAADYFGEIKETAISEDALEMAEALIARKSTKFDLSKFEDGYETAVRELVEAKVKHLPVPVEEAPKPQTGKIINLMDALRKSIGTEPAPARQEAGKKPPASVKEVPARKSTVEKAPAKTAPRRKTA
jgi:DNA end-binding protein Ku